MPCNCGKKGKKASVQFVYTSPKGIRTTFNTEVEAKAAQIRSGGGTVQPA